MPKSPSRTSKKKKYNARFPPARIKKIMQTDEDVGKVAAAVPVIISRALELFIESLITETSQTTLSRNAKTLSTFHIKQTIESNKQFEFLRDLVANVPDHQTEENNGDTALDGESSTRKSRGRPRKQKDPAERKKKGEPSKATSDTSEDEDDEDEEEDTETDEESRVTTATSSGPSYVPSMSMASYASKDSSHNRFHPPSVPSSSGPVPGMYVTTPQTASVGIPPTFTSPGMASLAKQQQQLQAYQEFQQQPQPLYQSSNISPSNSGQPYFPPYVPKPPQGMSTYPLPPQFPNSYQHMVPSTQTQYPNPDSGSFSHQQQQPPIKHRPQNCSDDQYHQEQQQAQPINLSYSSTAVASATGDNEDYDT